jgi:hypothetical protein
VSQASRIHETICTSESSSLTWHSYCMPVVATGMYGRAHASGHCKFSRQRVRIQLPFAGPWSIRLRRCSNVAADSEGEHHVLAVAPSVMARIVTGPWRACPRQGEAADGRRGAMARSLSASTCCQEAQKLSQNPQIMSPSPRRTPGVDGTLFVLLFQGGMWGAPSSVPTPCRASSPVQTQPELRSYRAWYSPVLRLTTIRCPSCT